MGREFDTRIIGKLVSEIAGQEVDVRWYPKRDMPPGLIGAANSERIMLDESLARRADPQLPEVIYHEMAHILLHKRIADKAFEISQEKLEDEAAVFTRHMRLELGDKFIWDALTGDVSEDELRQAKSTITKFSNSANFKRNRSVAEKYVRTHLTFEAQERLQQSGQRRTTSQPRRMAASALEAEAQRELALAGKVANSKVAQMIRDSAQAKRELANKGNGRRSGSGNNNYPNTQLEKATLHR